jgi:hypothetical protein
MVCWYVNIYVYVCVCVFGYATCTATHYTTLVRGRIVVHHPPKQVFLFAAASEFAREWQSDLESSRVLKAFDQDTGVCVCVCVSVCL